MDVSAVSIRENRDRRIVNWHAVMFYENFLVAGRPEQPEQVSRSKKRARKMGQKEKYEGLKCCKEFHRGLEM